MPKNRDYHTSTRLVRLPVWMHDLMKEAARRENRPLTWVVQRELRDYLQRVGLVDRDSGEPLTALEE